MFELGLSIEVDGDMDIDSHEVDIECPQCGFYNPIWIKQARLRDTIICRGCKNNIRLDDSMNTVRKVRNMLMKAFRELEAEIEKINRQGRW